MSQPGPNTYELYRERWRVVEWRDDAVFKTEKIDAGWFDEADVRSNKPRETNILFVMGEVPGNGVNIRRKR